MRMFADRDAGSIERPGEFSARLVTDIPSPYVLVAETLAEIHARLPPLLKRSARQSEGLPEVAEMWFSL